MTTLSRRDLIARSALLVAAGSVPNTGRAISLRRPGRVRLIDATSAASRSAPFADPDVVRTLAMAAIDAAKAAGAAYADVRLTRTVDLSVADNGYVRDDERLDVGVRCLIGGCWGFASSGFWRAEEMPVLAQTATRLAKLASAVQVRPVELAPVLVVTGHWSTPIEIDPFTVPLEEKMDWARATAEYMTTYRFNYWKPWGASVDCSRQERAVATTDGSYFTQTNYVTTANVSDTDYSLEMRPRGGMGYEVIRDAHWVEQVAPLVATIEAGRRSPIPIKPGGDIGRYDVVFSADAMTELLDRTLGLATEGDRLFGLETNASGTSYLGNDPLALLGSAQVASSLVNVSANRSMPRGLGTVKWDDEGVEAQDVTLVKDGILVDCQTTRETAAWLAPYYTKVGKPVRSNGHAGAESAAYCTLQRRPNLVLEPHPGGGTVDDLIKGVTKGYYVERLDPYGLDFQGRNGVIRAFGTREIVNGKLGAMVLWKNGSGGSMYINAPELWKNVIAVGGPPREESLLVSCRSHKGDPVQTTMHSIRAVPATISNIPFVEGL